MFREDRRIDEEAVKRPAFVVAQATPHPNAPGNS